MDSLGKLLLGGDDSIDVSSWITNIKAKVERQVEQEFKEHYQGSTNEGLGANLTPRNHYTVDTRAFSATSTPRTNEATRRAAVAAATEYYQQDPLLEYRDMELAGLEASELALRNRLKQYTRMDDYPVKPRTIQQAPATASPDRTANRTTTAESEALFASPRRNGHTLKTR
jgi:hypothetical protein